MRLLLSSGEASGELYAAELLRELRVLMPEVEAFGLGGDRLAAQGAALTAHIRELAVVGLVEVVSHLPRIRRIFHSVLAECERHPPDLAVLIDYPDFNLRLARQLRRRGIPVVYYVSPQVWAWRRGRIRTIRDTSERMLVIFPFEEAVYREAGVPVEFVGHPLVDSVRPPADPKRVLAEIGLDPERPTIALLPGSRAKEIALNLPPLLAAVARLRREDPALQFAVAVAPSLEPQNLERAFSGSGARLVQGLTPALLGSATLSLVASGTATIEAALVGAPMVVFYRVSPLSYALGRGLVRVPHFAMANLIAERRIVPELIQADFTSERLSAEASALLRDVGRRERMRGELDDVRRRLGEPGASARAARAVKRAWDALRERGERARRAS
jgi:lipid-A-disaccharide synthase